MLSVKRRFGKFIAVLCALAMIVSAISANVSAALNEHTISYNLVAHEPGIYAGHFSIEFLSDNATVADILQNGGLRFVVTDREFGDDLRATIMGSNAVVNVPFNFDASLLFRGTEIGTAGGSNREVSVLLSIDDNSSNWFNSDFKRAMVGNGADPPDWVNNELIFDFNLPGINSVFDAFDPDMPLIASLYFPIDTEIDNADVAGMVENGQIRFEISDDIVNGSSELASYNPNWRSEWNGLPMATDVNGTDVINYLSTAPLSGAVGDRKPYNNVSAAINDGFANYNSAAFSFFSRNPNLSIEYASGSTQFHDINSLEFFISGNQTVTLSGGQSVSTNDLIAAFRRSMNGSGNFEPRVYQNGAAMTVRGGEIGATNREVSIRYVADDNTAIGYNRAFSQAIWAGGSYGNNPVLVGGDLVMDFAGMKPAFTFCPDSPIRVMLDFVLDSDISRAAIAHMVEEGYVGIRAIGGTGVGIDQQTRLVMYRSNPDYSAATITINGSNAITPSASSNNFISFNINISDISEFITSLTLATPYSMNWSSMDITFSVNNNPPCCTDGTCTTCNPPCTCGTCTECDPPVTTVRTPWNFNVTTNTNAHGGHASLAWNTVSEADGYIVYAARMGENFAQIAETTQSNYTHSGLIAGDIWRYYVVAFKDTANGRIFSLPTNTVTITVGQQGGNNNNQSGNNNNQGGNNNNQGGENQGENNNNQGGRQSSNGGGSSSGSTGGAGTGTGGTSTSPAKPITPEDIVVNIEIMSSGVIPVTVGGVQLPANSIVLSSNIHGELGFDYPITITAAQLSAARLDPSKIRLFHISSEGVVTETANVVRVNEDGSVTVTVNRFSAYVLAEYAPVAFDNVSSASGHNAADNVIDFSGGRTAAPPNNPMALTSKGMKIKRGVRRYRVIKK